MRAGVEQRRAGRADEEGGEGGVELDRPLVARSSGFGEGEAHEHAHPEGLRQLDAASLVVDEIAIVERLQAEVAELQVAGRDELRAEPGQIERLQSPGAKSSCATPSWMESTNAWA